MANTSLVCLSSRAFDQPRRMTRVLFVSPMAEAGGSDQALLRMVGDLTQRGFVAHVVVPALGPLVPEFRALGATVHVIPMRRITTSGGLGWWLHYLVEWPIAVARLTRLTKRLDVDIVSSNSLHLWYAWAAARLARRPHVWHAREIVVQSRAALRLERWLVRRFADLLVSCSRAVDSQFESVLATERRIVVHEDVDRGRFYPRNVAAFRSLAGQQLTTPLVGFVGRIDTWKGLDNLLACWPRVLVMHPKAQLFVVGGPVADKEDFYGALRASAAGLDGVTWVGPLGADRIPDVMAELDVLVAPSTLPEPYGLVLVEALASGARVVASDQGGAPEIVSLADPGAGVTVPPGDTHALAKAISAELSSLSSLPRHVRPVLLPPLPVDWASVYGRSLAAARSRRAPA